MPGECSLCVISFESTKHMSFGNFFIVNPLTTISSCCAMTSTFLTVLTSYHLALSIIELPAEYCLSLCTQLVWIRTWLLGMISHVTACFISMTIPSLHSSSCFPFITLMKVGEFRLCLSPASLRDLGPFTSFHHYYMS